MIRCSKSAATVCWIAVWQQYRFAQANAQYLPFPDNTFDVITIAFGLRNVTDKEMALRSMYRVLKPGGKLAGAGIFQATEHSAIEDLRRLLL